MPTQSTTQIRPSVVEACITHIESLHILQSSHARTLASAGEMQIRLSGQTPTLPERTVSFLSNRRPTRKPSRRLMSTNVTGVILITKKNLFGEIMVTVFIKKDRSFNNVGNSYGAATK